MEVWVPSAQNGRFIGLNGNLVYLSGESGQERSMITYTTGSLRKWLREWAGVGAKARAPRTLQ